MNLQPKYQRGTRFSEDGFTSDGYIEIVYISPEMGQVHRLGNLHMFHYFLKEVYEDKVSYDCCDEQYLIENCWLIESDDTIF